MNDEDQKLNNNEEPPKKTGLFIQDNVEEYSDIYYSDNEETNTVFTKEFDAFSEDFNLENSKKISQTRVLDLTDEEAEAKKRKIFRITVIGISIAVILIAVYVFGVFYYKNVFFPETYINGINVGGENASEALSALQLQTDERSVLLEGKNNMTATVTGSEIGLTFKDTPDVEGILTDQNTYLWPFALIIHKQNEINSDYTVNRKLLAETINSLPMVSDPGITEPKDASLVFNGTDFEIVPAIEGDKLNIDKLEEEVELALVNGDDVLDLEEVGAYEKPSITEDNSQLKSDQNKLNDALKAEITLTFPTQNVILAKETYGPWLYIANNAVAVNNDDLTNYVAGLATQFDTVGKTLSFTTTGGETLTFKTPVGWELNQAQEVTQLRDQILAGTVTTESPIWSQTGERTITGNVITGNYIEVSLSDQKIWYYKNNELETSAAMVSGNVSSLEETPTGLFFIESKDTSVGLTVRLPNGNLDYRTVNYYLPFDDDLGIVSSTWRSNYGGTYYMNQGTNGNIDVPQSFAQTVYNNVNTGDPVVIY